MPDAANQPCPSDERLAAYTARSLTASLQGEIETHLHRCTHCVVSVQKAHDRLRVAEQVALPVPDSVLARIRPVTVLNGAAAPERNALSPFNAPGIVERVRDAVRWLTASLSPMMLVPVGAAALALLVIVHDTGIGTPRDPHTPEQIMHVVANEALVLPRPTSGEKALATLTRGAEVVILNETGEWFQVRLADGRTGWMDRQDFD